jgi:polar amino acid transport system substrate-binding protein
MSLLNKGFFLFLICLLGVSSLPIVQAQDDQKTLKVAIKPSEPWVMYDSNKALEERNPIGFSIDLWRGIAKEIGVKTEWVYNDNVRDLLDSVKEGKAHVGIAAITIRSDREKVVDFSTSMFELGLQIMVSADNSMGSPLMVLVKEVGKFMTTHNILVFLGLLFCVINIRWWADKRSPEASQIFSKNYGVGLYDAFWWSITMLLTWEAPKNRGIARLIDLSWHLIGLIALSILTGIIAATLTIQAVGGAIKSEKDLPGKRVAAVATDAPKDYLEKIGARVVAVDTLHQGIDLLLKGEVDALVHDGPRLSYLAEQINRKNKPGVLVLPAIFNQQNYGIIFPNGSELLESVNLALLKLREPEGLEKSFHEKLKEKWIPKTN